MDKETTIAIIGAGTFGLSTGLELARAGYKNVTCYDKYPVPSPMSAGNDSNKILDYEYFADDEEMNPDNVIRLESLEAWKTDPVYKDHFHQVGFILAACSEEPLADTKERVLELKLKGCKDYEYVDSPEKFRKFIPQMTGDLPGWRGYVLDKDNGWLHARNALISAYTECVKLGVKFVFGDDGEVSEFNFEEQNLASFTTRSNQQIKADRFVVTCGANVVSLLDFENQLESKCWTLAHIKLNSQELKLYRDLPVVYNMEKGFLFEPDENDEIKICNEFPGYTNNNPQGESIPVYKDEIPLEAEIGVRQFLKETIPHLADRELVKTKICWCTDSPDRQLILCTHPKYANLIIGSGDSGRSFMIMPAIGKYIAKVVLSGDTGLTLQQQQFWRWRPETITLRDDSNDRYGGSGKIQDLKELSEWVSVQNPIARKLVL